MGWERSVLGLFDDLEQQAAGLHLDARDAEVADLSRAEYAAVRWAARLYAGVGRTVQLRLLGGRLLGGRLARVGEDWLLLVDGSGSEWVVPEGAVATVAGIGERAVGEAARSVLTRLSLRSALRGLAAEQDGCVVHLRDDAAVEGRLGRVGADFVELRRRDRTELVRFAAVAAFQGRP